jgi:hypothetical protein
VLELRKTATREGTDLQIRSTGEGGGGAAKRKKESHFLAFVNWQVF